MPHLLQSCRIARHIKRVIVTAERRLLARFFHFESSPSLIRKVYLAQEPSGQGNPFLRMESRLQSQTANVSFKLVYTCHRVQFAAVIEKCLVFRRCGRLQTDIRNVYATLPLSSHFSHCGRGILRTETQMAPRDSDIFPAFERLSAILSVSVHLMSVEKEVDN
jgi:hypothetical protein